MGQLLSLYHHAPRVERRILWHTSPVSQKSFHWPAKLSVLRAHLASYCSSAGQLPETLWFRDALSHRAQSWVSVRTQMEFEGLTPRLLEFCRAPSGEALQRVEYVHLSLVTPEKIRAFVEQQQRR